jgi:hypothetical protein
VSTAMSVFAGLLCVVGGFVVVYALIGLVLTWLWDESDS